MDSILSEFLRNKDDDYYELLGCSELSSTEQIVAEFKSRAKLCHPDKVPDKLNAAAEFQRLQRAKEVLANEESRKKYDLWRRSGICIPYDKWCSLAAHSAYIEDLRRKALKQFLHDSEIMKSSR